MAMTLADFHFLRPLFLLALLPLAAMVWRARLAARATPWTRIVDPELLRVQRVPDSASARWPRHVAWNAAALAIVAAAGPAWQRVPQPLVETREARVIVLDLSRSMDAQDIKPSRATLARKALGNFLDTLPGGRIGIVVFAGSAFTVVPLTHDRRVALHLLDALTPDLMPVQGGRIAEGLSQGLRLLDDGRALQGELILVTDSAPDETAKAVARTVAAAGHRVWVVGVGTRRGAPVPLAAGALLEDRAGKLVVPTLDEDALADLAAAGHGTYARLTDAQIPIDPADWAPAPVAGLTRIETDVWRDEGRWLVLLLAPLAATVFRRGALAALAILLFGVPPVFAQDVPWWRSPNQAGLELLQKGQAAAAAATFRDARWRGVAEYRAGSFAAAADAFADGDAADDHYNRGNALARAGQYPEAVAAYEEAMVRQPDMADAAFNRDLVHDLLAAQGPPEMSLGGADMKQAGGTAGAGPGAKSRNRDGDGQRDTPAGKGRSPAPGTTNSGATGSPPASADDEAVPGTGPAHAAADAAEPSANGPSQGGRAPQPRPGAANAQQAAGASADAAGSSGAAALRANDETARTDDRAGAEAVEWLRHVEEGPGALLRRKFQLEQARRPVAHEASEPW